MRGAFFSVGVYWVACCMVVCAVAVCAPASAWGARLSIQEQEALLWRAVESVFEQSPELAAQARLLGVGSWMSGTAGAASDIDVTVGCRDAATERKLAERIRARVSELAGGAEHEINVTWRRDHLFEDRFRGEVGQKFFYDYADKSGEYRSCYVYEAGEGGLSRRRVQTERFWLDHELAVPKNVEGAYRFVEDSVIFLERYSTKPTLVQAEKAAKYLNNYEGFLKTELRRGVGSLDGLAELPPAMRERMQALLAYKAEAATDAAGALERLGTRLGVDSEVALEAEMRAFVRDTRRYLITARDDVELVEKLHRSGLLDRAGGPARAVKMRDELLSRIFKQLRVPLAAADAYMILKAYYEGGPQAAIMETGISLAGYAVPPALLAGLVADLVKEVFVAGVEWTGNALVFDPVNDSFLRGRVYAPDSPVHIFTWDQSPFKGLTRETLACRFGSPEMLRAGVNRYLDQAKGWNAGLFATEGAGDVTPRLLAQMSVDLEKSQDWLSARQQEGLLLALGDYEGVPRPLEVVVNGREAGEGSVGLARVTTADDGVARFEVLLMGEFGFGRIVPPSAGYYEKIICERGWEKAAQWLKANLTEQYRPGYDVRCAVRLGENTGWILTGPWPADGAAIRLGSGGGRFAAKSLALLARPGKGAVGEFAADLTFTITYKDGFEDRRAQRSVRLIAGLDRSALLVRVLDAATGRPIPGAGVAASGPSGLSGAADGVGEVRFDAVSAGTYSVRAGAPGYQKGMANAEVRPGDDAVAVVRLTPLPEDKGRENNKGVLPRTKPESIPDNPKPAPPATKARPVQETAPSRPSPEQACACLHQWKMGPEQQELVESARRAYSDFCGAEMRAIQAIRLENGRCVGEYEFWSCRKSAQPDNWWMSSSWSGSVGTGEAAALCGKQ
ncbi:carboxypeptidase-like regulatory domain-containing protein [Paucidesulfovibrio longus]|uniref:carboxypeptidase-like regulatory domain-containing protein n=1 Tax=Paucidesulfovibrio longus TaxID=889 RepID=UPI0003B57D98|nr:carboxypeptidase-like regulatory domain-containing protein [Paucidesulfovibrio longus]